MKLWTLLTLLALWPTTVRAQEPGGDEEFSVPWRTNWYPLVSGRSNDGPLLSVRLRHRQDGPYEARTTYTRAFDAGAGGTPQGSRFAYAEFDAPLHWRPWRFTVAATANREARFGYYGLGNEATYDGDLVTDAQPFRYRVKRTRYLGAAQVSRYLSPTLLVALAGEVGTTRFASLPGPSLFDADFGPLTLEEDDASARLALVLDTRDVEYNTRRGALLEAGAQVGSGGGNYTRLYTVLRGYVAVRENTVVAARLVGAGTGGRPTLNARFTVPAWDRPIPVLGGEFSHRALDAGRLAGRRVLLGNLEVRHDLLNFGDLGAITLLGFVDAGRVFEAESFALTTNDLTVGGGGGLGVRVLRGTVFTLNFAGGPDGFNFSVGKGWMF